eukprot:Sspe_Gene.118974::Locus_113648_Transcript_1_1_Confidence_1.000_Length_911::g.118974::m.118974
MTLLQVLLLAAGAVVLGQPGWANGKDLRLSPRQMTRRWITFHPVHGNSAERVTFTFTGFWPNSGRTLRVRLAKDETCTPEYVAYGSGQKLEQHYLSANRTASFLLPTVQSGSWSGGFCFLMHDRWHFVDQPLVVRPPPSPTAELMQGYQSCENFVWHHGGVIKGLCGCYVLVSMDDPASFAVERNSPVQIPMNFDNARLITQTTSLHLVQGCCERWTSTKTRYHVASSVIDWGYCADST